VVKPTATINATSLAPNKPHQPTGPTEGPATSGVRRDPPPPLPAASSNSAPKKLTLKQKLKQEINALKKQKQLIQMQKEAQERRKRVEQERAAKEEERQRWMQARQAEQQARMEEKMRRKQEKQDAIERKRLEKLALQQAAAAKQEQEQRDYEQALAKYHQDLEEYRGRHSKWLNERRQWMQACQQQCTVPWYSQSMPRPAMVAYPQFPPVAPSMGNPSLIRNVIEPSPTQTENQNRDVTSTSNLTSTPSVPFQAAATPTLAGNDGIPSTSTPTQADNEGMDTTSTTHLDPTQNSKTDINSDGIQTTPTNVQNQSCEADSQSLAPATQSVQPSSIASAPLRDDTIQPVQANTNNQHPHSNTTSQALLPIGQMIPTPSQSNNLSLPHAAATPTTVTSFTPIHPGWGPSYQTGAMALHSNPYSTGTNASTTSFMHYMARDQSSLPMPSQSWLYPQMNIAPTQPWLPPQMTQPLLYSTPHHVSQAVANMTYMMSLMPSHLKTPPTPPIPPKKPKGCMPKKKPEVVEQPLGVVMEPPSPYATTHVLLNVTLIRSLDQPSYGVNLKALTTTVLVDAPQREPKQPIFHKMQPNDNSNQQTHASVPGVQPGPSENQSGSMNIDQNNANGGMLEESSNQNLNNDSKMAREVNNELNSTKDKDSESDISTTLPNPQDTEATEAMEDAAVQNGSLPMEVDRAPTASTNQNESASTDTMTSIEPPAQDNNSLSVKAELPSMTTTTTAANVPASGIKATFPRKPRRRRINFTVMTVVDAERQNARWNLDEGTKANKEPITLLEPGDIIVSIGGKDVAGCRFTEACAIFAQMSVQTTATTPNGESRTEIQTKLVIARKKQVPSKAKSDKPINSKVESNSNSESKSQSSSDSQPLGNSSKLDNALSRTLLNSKALLAPANASLRFSVAEIAVLADGIIQAIHDQPTSRLLGQEISAGVLANKTTIFRQVANLKDCILSHRSPETLFAKWSQLCQSMSTSLAEQSRAAWNRQALLVETSNDELSSLSYSSEAERTALRQLPRPNKGCRCQRQDHEYVHDVRCSLYQDICRLLPTEELQELQYDPNRIQKSRVNTTVKDLNTVETAFKDRFVKLKTAAELEEAEARFVARMEEIQVKQLRKAIFAPNLTTMVLSSIMDLQREFPDTGPSVESDSDDSDDESFDDELLLSGKRKPRRSNKESKKSKVNQVKNINFKYLTRIVQHIGKTWGHVYREPSHEDYAW
jgi:hypothetical protein